jgi:hypothetical protein
MVNTFYDFSSFLIRAINIFTLFMFPCKYFDIFLHKYGSVIYDAFKGKLF